MSMLHFFSEHMRWSKKQYPHKSKIQNGYKTNTIIPLLTGWMRRFVAVQVLLNKENLYPFSNTILINLIHVGVKRTIK